MKTFTKIIFVLILGILGCNHYETERNNPFDPKSKNSLYYIQLLSGSGISGLTGTGSGTSTGTGTGNTGKPDLQLVSFSPPSTMLHENTYNISATITNAGTASASGFYVSLYLSPFGGISNGCNSSANTNVGVIQVTSLAVGASSTLSIPLTVWESTSTGISYIAICLDSGFAIAESDETNNYGSSVGSFIKNVTVGEYRPDITLVSFTPPSPMTRGSSYNLSATIKNSGNRDDISAFYVSVYLSPFGGISNGCNSSANTNVGLVQVASLASGLSTTLSIPLTVWASTSTGLTYIAICLDSGYHITEYTTTGETNNYGTAVGTHIKQVTVN